jgi:LuxR family maltose regulon positive regulatory protein
VPPAPGSVDGVPIGDIVLQLTGHLADAAVDDLVVVVDGLDRCGAACADGLALLVRHLPGSARVVFVSRHALALGVDRLRVRGELVEVGFDDLRCSAGAAERGLRALVPDADTEFVNEAVARADGWRAVLGLAATAWRHRREPAGALALLDQLTYDYVCHEIIAAEDPALVRFLLDISVVDAVTASLADRIRGRDDSASMLDRAGRRGVFVAPVGMRGWWEFHPAVLRALRTEAEWRDRDRVRTGRRAAAQWLVEDGRVIEATNLLLELGETSEAWSLLAQHQVGLCAQGLDETVRLLVEQLSAQSGPDDLESSVLVAWCNLLLDREEYLAGVARARWWSRHDGEADDRTLRRLDHLSAIAALISGDLDESMVRGHASLAGYAGWFDDPLVVTAWNDLARVLALDERWSDSSDEVMEIEVSVRRSPARTAVFEATRALGEALAGRPVDALRVIGGVRATLTETSYVFSRVEVALAEVIARREMGDAPDAPAQLRELVANDLEPMTYVRAIAAAELTQAQLDTGALDEAGASFELLEELVAVQMPGPLGELLAGRVGTVLALAQGRPAEAERQAARIADTFWGPLSAARVAAATRPGEVADLLARASPRSPRHQVVATMLAATTTKDHERALDLAVAAGRLASDCGMLVTLAAPEQIDLLERVAGQLPVAWMDRLRTATASAQVRRPVLHLVEPLTDRERDVLRFLASRLTLKEIAGELFISINTLKFHLKVIYRKLGVTSRAEAAEIARDLGRIPMH